MKILKIKSNNFTNSKYSKIKINEYDKNKIKNTFVYFRDVDNFDKPVPSPDNLIGKIIDYNDEKKIYYVEVNDNILESCKDIIEESKFIDDVGLGLSIIVQPNTDLMNLYSEDYDIEYGFLSVNYENAKNIGYYQHVDNIAGKKFYDEDLSDAFRITMQDKGYCVFDLCDTINFECDGCKQTIINSSILSRIVNLCDEIFIVLPKNFNKEILFNYDSVSLCEDENLPWVMSVIREFKIPYRFINRDDIINNSLGKV